jgi:REP element-mobilizing transposase RayT
LSAEVSFFVCSGLLLLEIIATFASYFINGCMTDKGETDNNNGGRFRRETIHHQHRRSYWHDYHELGLYMLTMVIEGRQRLFGTIVGSAKGRPGSSEAPHVTLSELGRRVLEEEVPKIHRFYPMVEVWRVAIMPDHIHMLVRVNAPLPQGKHLGHVVRGFKTGCSRAWWRWQDEQVGRLGGETPSTTAAEVAAVPEASPSGNRPVLYEQGYHDRIINRPGMLENIKRYMDENPLRARIRQECPRLMERQLHLWIAGREYAAFGNLFLLKYPIKEQVFFHRRDKATGQPTELTEAFHQEHARLLRVAEEGTVLVTPGISKGEQQVVSDALDACLPLILLQKDPIGEYWKPSQRRFYACAAGYLLILAPWQVDDSSDYAGFHQLNDYAREVCSVAEMPILNYGELKKSR